MLDALDVQANYQLVLQAMCTLASNLEQQKRIRRSKQMALRPLQWYIWCRSFTSDETESSPLDRVLPSGMWELVDPKGLSLIKTLSPPRRLGLYVACAWSGPFFEGGVFSRFYSFPLKMQTALWPCSLMRSKWRRSASFAQNFSSSSKQIINIDKT